MLAAIDSMRVLLGVGVAILVAGLVRDSIGLDGLVNFFKQLFGNLNCKKEKVAPVTKTPVATSEVAVDSKTKAPDSPSTLYLVKEWLDVRDGVKLAGLKAAGDKLDDVFPLLNVEKKG